MDTRKLETVIRDAVREVLTEVFDPDTSLETRLSPDVVARLRRFVQTSAQDEASAENAPQSEDGQ